MNLHRHNNDNGFPTRELRLSSPWATILAIFFIGKILLVIAGVIVISLIPLYLSRKSEDISVNNPNDRIRSINMAFAVTSAISTSQAVTNYDSVAKQVNQHLKYPANIFNAQSAQYYAVAATGVTTKRKKRQATDKLSCETGAKLNLVLYVNVCPSTGCHTSYCFEKCIPTMKSQIRSELGSEPLLLNIKTADGSTSTVLAQFCSFDNIVPTTLTTNGVTTASTTSTTSATTSTGSTTSATEAEPETTTEAEPETTAEDSAPR
ncbi:unnamed protein product [Adineta ricciae]|uniref:Uncharacterized protein n=1 Tax=Adineta ricciae TaxID=249248 RepID=A0A815YAE3_ADIRI|nr:unnamed protein product [Adineta ricciae]CAF1568125.1 unnamed protein product [Adineta ricciae]